MDTYHDIEEKLGRVPGFLQEIPPQALEGFWLKMRDFEMAETAIPNKYKDLIGVAVAATIPCAYCTFFHKEAARMNGATEAEIREAIQMAAGTREGSTLLNGSGQDLESFQAEMRDVFAHVRREATRGAEGLPRA